MDTKFILSNLLAAAGKFGAAGQVEAAVRFNGSVNGNAGEGYWLLFENALLLLYRVLGEYEYHGCCGKVSKWSYSDYCQEACCLRAKLSCGTEDFAVEFSLSEQHDAEFIMQKVAAANTDPLQLYPEKILNVAALFYLLSDESHREFALKLLGDELFSTAGRFAEQTDIQSVTGRCNELLSQAEKESVLTNLIDLRMSDYLWESNENAALQELAAVWDISTEFYTQCSQILLLRKKIGSLFEN